MTSLFVLVFLGVTCKEANATTASFAIGPSLVPVQIFEIPITGSSVDSARSLGPALTVGGAALSQVRLVLVALLGGAAATLFGRALFVTT